MFRYLAAHELAAGLGPEKAPALSMFHALTGWDMVPSFAEGGTKTAWTVCTVLPELTGMLLKVPSDIPENVIRTIETFVILLYDRTSTYSHLQDSKETFHKEEHCASDSTN